MKIHNPESDLTTKEKREEGEQSADEVMKWVNILDNEDLLDENNHLKDFPAFKNFTLVMINQLFSMSTALRDAYDKLKYEGKTLSASQNDIIKNYNNFLLDIGGKFNSLVVNSKIEHDGIKEKIDDLYEIVHDLQERKKK